MVQISIGAMFCEHWKARLYSMLFLSFEWLLKQHIFHCPCSSPEHLDRMTVSKSVSSFPCYSILWDMSFSAVVESKPSKWIWNPLLPFKVFSYNLFAHPWSILNTLAQERRLCLCIYIMMHMHHDAHTLSFCTFIRKSTAFNWYLSSICHLPSPWYGRNREKGRIKKEIFYLFWFFFFFQKRTLSAPRRAAEKYRQIRWSEDLFYDCLWP